MACDGHIDPREIALIQHLDDDHTMFGDLDLQSEINQMVEKINSQGFGFLRTYLLEIKQTNLTPKEEISIIKVAIKTIDADEKVEYSEIRFFKLLRSYLKVSNKTILGELPGIEDYLERDIISPSYIQKLTSAYFDNQKWKPMKTISLDQINGLSDGVE